MASVHEIRNHIESDRPHGECGLFALMIPPSACSQWIAQPVFEGLHQNQHRGEESAGIVLGDGKQLHNLFKEMGFVHDVYAAYMKLPYMPSGYIGLGHTRYSTTGKSNKQNAGPFVEHSDLGAIAVGHNGNITNASSLKAKLMQKGARFESTTDSEVLAKVIADAAGSTWEEKLMNALPQLEGSFSLAMITKDTMFAARDRLGNRPLYVAQGSIGDQHWSSISSETQALHMFSTEQIEEVLPGELIQFADDGVKRTHFAEGVEEAFCGLEIAYLLRGDGEIRHEGYVQQVDLVRRNLGEALAQLYPPPTDVQVVSYIPESSRSTAEGYMMGLRKQGRDAVIKTSMMKNRYGSLSGNQRAFMSPEQHMREGVAHTGYFVYDWVEGQKLVVVDDSIIRGTTTGPVIENLRRHGAREIHLRIPWPPVKGYCPLGTDISKGQKLLFIEAGEDIEKMRKLLNVDSLAFLSPEQYQQTVDEAMQTHLKLCQGCCTGNYPVTVFSADKLVFEQS